MLCVVLIAKPPHVKRFRVIVVVRLDPSTTRAFVKALAWTLHEVSALTRMCHCITRCDLHWIGWTCDSQL